MILTRNFTMMLGSMHDNGLIIDISIFLALHNVTIMS